jgi:D-alanine transaminase
MPTGLSPTVFVMASEMKLATPAQREHGVACVSADDFRWQKAHIKSHQSAGLGVVPPDQRRCRGGGDCDVSRRLPQRSGASNVWVVKDGVVMGPPKDHLVLEGIRFRH